MAQMPKQVNPFQSRNQIRQNQRTSQFMQQVSPTPGVRRTTTRNFVQIPKANPTPSTGRYPMKSTPPAGVSYVRVPWQDVWKGKIAPPMNRPVNLPQGQKWETPGVLVPTSGGRYYAPETGPELIEPKRTWVPPDYQPTYWEDPHRVARWHNAIQAMPPGWTAPEWLDVDSVNAAYEYMKYTNNDLPWYSWKWLSPTDPGREFLKGLSAPPPEMLWQGEENFGLQHTEPTPWMQMQQAQQEQVPEYVPTTSPEEVGDPSQGGMTDAQWDALPGWQRTMITILNSPVTAGAMGALPGAMVGLGVGGPVGALIGGVAGGAAGMYSQQNPESSIAQAMMLLDYPRQWLEQGLGTLGQITGAATTPGGKYGTVADILNNLPSAWQAARLTYDVQGEPFNLIPEWITGVHLKPGETWQLGNPNPVQTGYTGDVDLDALTEARNRIIAGEAPETVYQDISAKMGISGQWRDLVSGFVLDPLNAVPWATKAGGKGLAELAGNEKLALAFDTSHGLTEAIRTYSKELRLAPIEEVSKMDAFSKYLGGLTPEGQPRILANPQEKGGIFNYLTHLTPAARASEVVNNSGIELAVLLERAGDNPDEMVRLIHSVANTPDELARELSMQSLNSADAAAIPMALKDFGTKADEHLAAWEASRWQRTVVENIAQVTGKKAEKVIQELNEGDPELLLKQFIEKAKTVEGDAAKALVSDYESGELTGLKLQSIVKGFAKDNVPYTADMFRANLYADMMEHTADWGAKWFGVKPDPTWLRLANTVKSAQSLVLLGLNPTFMVNNALNNIVTMAVDGVLGGRTNKAIQDIWTRALGGVEPARLRAKALPFDLGEGISTPIRAAQQVPGVLTDIQDFFRTKTKKIQVFGNLSGEIEGLSSQQAYTSGFMQAMSRLWKRGTGFERMPIALEQQLNAIDPNLGELIYGAIQGGMNKQEIEKALWGGVIKRNAGSAVPEIIRRTGMSEADVNEALTHAGMFEPEFADLLSNAQGNDEIINLINQRELKVQDYLDKITADNLEGEAARIAGTVKSEGLQGVLKIYDDMSYADSREWMEHTAHMTHMMENAAEMEPGERNAYIRGEQQKARQEWNRTNARRKNQYLAISNGLGLDSETGRRITGYLTEHEENWKGFYKTRDEMYDRYFNTEYDTKEQRLAAWNALQDDLNRRYKDAGQKRNEIQTRMDKEFTDLFSAQYGEEAGKTATKWRKGIRDINDRMEKEMFGFRDSIRKLPKEEKRLAWLDFNQKSRYKDMADLYTENMKGAMEVYEYLTGKRPTGAGAATPPEPPPQIPSTPTRVKVTDRSTQLRTRINDLRLEGGPDWVDQMTNTLKAAQLDDGELKHLMQKENQDALNAGLPISEVTERGAADPAAAVFIERYPGIGKQQTGEHVQRSMAFAEKTSEADRINQQVAEVKQIAADNGMTDRQHILNFVHKYGGSEGNVNYVENITPEVMRRAVETKAAAVEKAKTLQPELPEPELTNNQRHANQIRNLINEGDYNGALSNVRRVTDPAVREAIFEAVPELKSVVEKGDVIRDAIYENRLSDIPPEVSEEVQQMFIDMGNRVENSDPGYRIQLETGEWKGQSSTYPDWYKAIYQGATYDGKKGRNAVLAALDDLSRGEVKTKAGGDSYRVVSDLLDLSAKELENGYNSAYRKALGYQFDFDYWEHQLYKVMQRAKETDSPDTLSYLLSDELKPIMDMLPEDAPDLYMQRLGNLQEYILNKLEPPVDENPMAPDVQQIESGKVSQAGWGEDVRQFAPDADVQAEAITPEIHMAQVRRDLRAAFIERFLSGQEEVLSGAWSAEQQADAVLGILDARARAWAKRTGRTSAEWYATRIEGIGDTPENVGKLLQDMPRAPKGAVDFTADGRAVIYALQSPNVTTLVHEIGHIFRRDLEDADLDAAAKWGGLTDAAEMRRLELDAMNNVLKPGDADYERWLRSEEKFAYGFERYLKDGIAPTPELGNLFEQFKDWISQIYARLRSSMVNDLTPEMRGVYDRLLAESDAGDFPIQTETGRARVQNPNAYIRELLNTTTEEQAAKIMQAGLGTTPKETGGTPLFQLPTEQQPIWYSALENGVAGIPMERMTVAQMRGMLQKAGVKPDEMKWTGFDEWLNGRESVTKAEALDYLKQNGVQVEEVVKGEQVITKPNLEQLGYEDYRVTYPNGTIEHFTTRTGAEMAMETEEYTRNTPPTKYSQYTLPGGENYRELLMTLPVKATNEPYHIVTETNGLGNDFFAVRRDADNYFLGGGETEEAALRAANKRSTDLAASYQSPHWQEPNVLAHVRFNDRVDADGKKVLFIEEIQSDWHQAGREKGYINQADVKLIANNTNGYWEVKTDNGEFITNVFDQATEEGAITEARRRLAENRRSTSQEYKVPPAPFAKTWPELSMKRMIQWASENGYDRIAWTTGEQQAERYNLANFVDTIEWGGGDGYGTLRGLKDGMQVLDEKINASELPNYVGKEAAQKLLSSNSKTVEYPSGNKYKYIEGNDLQVGGYGMKAFYDRMLPEAMDKYIKKWGGKTQETFIGTAPHSNDYYSSGVHPEIKMQPSGTWGIFVDNHLVSGGYAAKADAMKAANLDQVHSFDVTPPMRESVLTRGQPLFQATFEDGRTVPIPDAEQPAPALNMLGSTDTIQPTPPLDRMQEEGWNNWKPIFDEMKGYFTNKERQTPGSVLNQVLDEDTARLLKSYLGNIYGQMADTKLAAIKSGEMKRDMALLNYSQRTGFDNVLGAVLPYSFWTTHSAVNWGLRAIDRPALMANYARIRNFQNNVVNVPGFPSRLKNKMKIPMPFLPDWAGDGIYIDPFKAIFPFENLTRPFEQWQTQRTQEQRRAETILQMWVEDEQMDATTAQQAIQSHQGDAWDKAVAQAKLDTEGEISNPLDFAFLISGPSLPIGWLYNVAKGTPEKINQLPITKFIQSATALMGANKGRGVNIEGPIRKALGLPERDWLQDYRVERMLANMTAEGKLTSNQAIQAMIDKTGPYYEEAQARVAKAGAVSTFGSFTGADLFPEGEAEQRGLKIEYDTAINAYEAGQTDALTKFWDAHPEYEARRAMGQDPEKRMRQFLISQVWDGWNNAQDLTKRDLTEGLGNLFQDNFLNKETRSYDTIDTDTLAMWAKVMGGTVPEAAGNVPTLPINVTDPQIVTQYQDYQDQRDQYFPGISRLESIYYGIPEGEGRDRWAAQHPELDEYNQWKNAYFAQHPEIINYAIGEDNKVAGQKPEIQARYYQFQAYRDSQFPDIYAKQDEYFSLPEKSVEREAYLAENPDLPAYWDWRKQYMAQYPEMIPYLMSTESLASKVLGTDYQTPQQIANAQVPEYSQDYLSQDYLTDQELGEFSPALIRQVMGHFYANQTLGSGAQKELRRIYNLSGRQMSFDEWIDVVIKNTFGLQRENILQ